MERILDSKSSNSTIKLGDRQISLAEMLKIATCNKQVGYLMVKDIASRNPQLLQTKTKSSTLLSDKQILKIADFDNFNSENFGKRSNESSFATIFEDYNGINPDTYELSHKADK